MMHLAVIRRKLGSANWHQTVVVWGAVLTYLLYLGALLYFNVFYVFRSLAIGLMIILAPIFIAMMALSESKRELAMAWFKEFCANLFIQPLQALMLSFILLVQTPDET